MISFVIQAHPAQEQPATNKIEEEFNKLYETLKQGLENISKDPKVQDLMNQGREFAQKLQQEASKLIPKTDEAAAA